MNTPSTNTLEKLKIDWNAPDVLQQILGSIQLPLQSIMEASSETSSLSTTEIHRRQSAEIIFSNSKEIKILIEKVLTNIESKAIRISDTTTPILFKIYENNEHVQLLCRNHLDTNRISKSDRQWLYQFEQEVFQKSNSNQLNLTEISYQLAISERQLHRKIKHLLHLTPNKYIRILKLHKAKELLDNYTYDTLSEIAYAVGFSDTHYFSKIFNQQYKTTPKELLTIRR
ncbi:helix-turn-helix transcriptional regulator [Aquimarina sp. ERC-38]|uniref:helix-turn-helix transcriptional regulator n=1 Tax=Aquimarina sp. ERC-38 TaxID=2949996 RepID=UPI0022481936|nr:helix-turn-helix transcriptional regulator [Aquimarina sp. ERC-38]UZO82174.1 helix-turn-helix transcriptional regulator [Aquimarina sp. ERC-38]